MKKIDKKKLKASINETLKKEILNEGPLDSIASVGRGIANVGRGVAGQFRLGQINSKLERSAKKLQQDWSKTEDFANKKAQKMQSSKNPQIARMGNQVAQNVRGISNTMNQALGQIGSLANWGAEVDTGAAKMKGQNEFGEFQHGMEQWMKNWGVNPNKIGKEGYHQMYALYSQALQAGVDLSEVDPRDYAKIVNQQIRPHYQNIMGATDSEQKEEPKKPSKQSRIEPEKAKALRDSDDWDERHQEFLRQYKQMEQEKAAKKGGVSEDERAHGRRGRRRARGRKLNLDPSRIKIQQAPAQPQSPQQPSPQASSAKAPEQKKPFIQKYLGGPESGLVGKIAGQAQKEIGKTVEKYAKPQQLLPGLQKDVGQFAKQYITPQQEKGQMPQAQTSQPQKVQPQIPQPQPQKAQAQPNPSLQMPPKAEKPVQMPSMQEFHDEEEAAPFPLTKKEKPEQEQKGSKRLTHNPFANMSLTDLAAHVAQQQKSKKGQGSSPKVPIEINDQGETQIGSSETGESGFVPAKDKIAIRKSSKSKANKPSKSK